MDIEEFYAANEHRRSSSEVELGRDWTDDLQQRFALSWVADTRDLYLMIEPLTAVFEDPLGDITVNPEETSALQVEILGQVESLEVLHEALSGWEAAMPSVNSLAWLREALKAAGFSAA
ncbi:MAG: hypothetical protein WCO31_00720 [Actinomycetes bacterium]